MTAQLEGGLWKYLYSYDKDNYCVIFETPVLAWWSAWGFLGAGVGSYTPVWYSVPLTLTEGLHRLFFGGDTGEGRPSQAVIWWRYRAGTALRVFVSLNLSILSASIRSCFYLSRVPNLQTKGFFLFLFPCLKYALSPASPFPLKQSRGHKVNFHELAGL